MTASPLAPFPSETEMHELELAGGAHLRVFSRGAGERTVIFLHGFPSLALTFRAQLAACPPGFRFIAPDMRGYGGSSAPREVSAYRLPTLVGEVLALADSFGAQQFDLVGHDWGGAVGWALARSHPQRLRTLTVLSCPPGELFARALARPRQLWKSWYMFLFQLPWLPERLLTLDPTAFIKFATAGFSVNPTPFTPEALTPIAESIRAHGLPGINYYRAGFREAAPPPPPLIRLPTQLIWGLGDRALGPWFADPASYRRIAEPFELVALPEAGHWPHEEAPEQVNAALQAHWSRWSGSTKTGT